MKRILFTTLFLIIPGCASFQGMDASQIKAAVADKQASAICARVTGLWGQATTVIANLDQRVIDSGGMTVSSANGDCTASMNTVKATPVPKTLVATPVDPSKVPQ